MQKAVSALVCFLNLPEATAGLLELLLRSWGWSWGEGSGGAKMLRKPANCGVLSDIYRSGVSLASISATSIAEVFHWLAFQRHLSLRCFTG